MNILQNLKESDPIISKLINSEKNRQETHLELIASENFASMAVMQAQGSVLTNKYAEGLPQKRYYGGCLLYTSPSPRDRTRSRMPSSA